MSALRIFCVCGTKLPEPTGINDSWGSWRCVNPRCTIKYCQDCGSWLDHNDQCADYTEDKEKLWPVRVELNTLPTTSEE